MNVLVLGATGFIGSHVANLLLKEGYDLVCGVRDIEQAKRLYPKSKFIQCDFEKDIDSAVWESRLQNIDVIINCIGIFYHPDKKIIWNIHYHTPKALYDAARTVNVKKIIHLSALNTELYSVAYAESKKATEDYLVSSDVNAIILKPSLVYGADASGGMKLFRQLASVPLFIFVAGKGDQQFQPIYIDDLIKAILQILKQPVGPNKILAAVSSSMVTLLDIIKGWRQWLGFANAYIIHVPTLFINLINYINDKIPYSTVNSDASQMLSQNNTASREEYLAFEQEIGFKPTDFNEVLSSHPSTAQDRWFSSFTLLRPLFRLSLAAIWIISAVTSAFLYPHTQSFELLSIVGIPSYLHSLVLYSACIINFLLGILLLFNYKAKLNYLIQLLVMLVYTLIITIKLPYLWLEPFGPVAKNLPLFVLVLFLYTTEGDQ